MPDSVFYYGSDLSPSEPIFLKAGPLSLFYNDGMIRSIRFGEHEIVRRVYMALRDQYWNTIPFQITPVVSLIEDSSFEISFEALHKKREIHFKWIGRVTGDPDGNIRFEMKGEALCEFQHNRIGLCVLHPLELCAGRSCTIEKVNGDIVEKTFPVFISPFQPFTDLRSISYGVPPAAKTVIRFEGDTFEMEDQRNWTDASFKTYSTHHSIPIPASVEKGTVIEQSVTISLCTSEHVEESPPKAIEIKVPQPDRHSRYIPGTGVVYVKNVTPKAAELLHALNLSHLRINIDCDSEFLVEEMESAAGACSHLGFPAELALYFTSNYMEELRMMRQVLRTSQIPVRRFLIYRKDFKVTPVETVAAAVTALQSYAPSAQIGSGTDSYFVEVNRSHPDTGLLDFLCYSANPQVHTTDNAAVMENLPGLAETLRTASLFQGKAHLSISPITLYPRKKPDLPMKAGGADPRQKGLFCAAWTLGSLMYCIEGSAASLTYFESTGPAGLMPSDGSSVYPVYHVLAAAGELAGATAQSCICNDLSRVACFVCYKGISLYLFIANLTESPLQVTVFDLPATINLLRLDETTFEEATRFPQLWRCKKGEVRTSTGPFHVFDILPYGILSIEGSLAK
ncbi:MAG: hypothetical protein GX556_18740 [Fibrobacter sp.]|nr:hypothetical protein [Fibrobacter sp.]